MYRGVYFLNNVRICLDLLNYPTIAPIKAQCLRNLVTQNRYYGRNANNNRGISTSLSPQKITEILATNEIYIGSSQLLPAFIKSIECNQLASNNPIEDRIRVSSIQYPSLDEPTIILGVFDGHGGGTTADIICRRLFNYIAISLHPDPEKLEISNRLNGSLIDLHNSPKLNNDPRLLTIETEMLNNYRDDAISFGQGKTDIHNLSNDVSIDEVAKRLKVSFQRCDDDLSKEIQNTLTSRSGVGQQALLHYSYAATSGCCAIVMVIHRGIAYIASSGDCRAVLGLYDSDKQEISDSEHDLETKLVGRHIQPSACSFKAIELNDEHNCDNINEVRRLAASHPKSEQNTMIKQNRLLGSLMPFRAFGDYQYKWPTETIEACGLRQMFQHYQTPPYLITEPDIRAFKIDRNPRQSARADNCSVEKDDAKNLDRYIVMASDGLWEWFESSRDVIETLVDHTINAYREGNEEDYDENCATYLLRSALRYGPTPDIGMDQERLRQHYHIRLQSILTLPRAMARNYRDDISIVLIKL